MSVKSTSAASAKLLCLNIKDATTKMRQQQKCLAYKSLSLMSASCPSPSNTMTSLTPNLTSSSNPLSSSTPNQEQQAKHHPIISLPSIFGDKYILMEQLEASNLYRCINTENSQQFCCKVVPTKTYYEFMSGHLRMSSHVGINSIEQVVVGKTNSYILFPQSFGDLHSYVRNQKRLKESEAVHLFHQIASIVADCHSNGIILRDLKLRKFVFSDKERTLLKLETLEDAILLEDADEDQLVDKHGCPAYVSPEVLSTSKGGYSGKSADCWSLGVILYTMLVGRYPFHDPDLSILFHKIRKAAFLMPETMSAQAKCLVRSLLRRDPTERLTSDDVLYHKWFKQMSSPSSNYFKFHHSSHFLTCGQSSLNSQYNSMIDYYMMVSDQTVPDLTTKSVLPSNNIISTNYFNPN